MNLSLNEISNHKSFEDLVISYFEDSMTKKGTNIIDIEVKPSGTGADGGRDILVIISINDNISTYKMRWIVQCKFHSSDISTDKIADINIPTLLHSYNACGYLLVCKQKPTSKLTNLFEDLETNCIFGKKYVSWSGEQFKRRIISNEKIIQQYFPKYFQQLIKLKGK